MRFTKAIAFYPALAQELGSIESALYYQQICYWAERATRDDGFIWKSKVEFERETGVGRYMQDRVRKDLIKRGWIEVKKTNANGAPTLHFKPLFDFHIEKTLILSDKSNPTNRLVESNQSITESTTYITNNMSSSKPTKKMKINKDRFQPYREELVITPEGEKIFSAFEIESEAKKKQSVNFEELLREYEKGYVTYIGDKPSHYNKIGLRRNYNRLIEFYPNMIAYLKLFFKNPYYVKTNWSIMTFIKDTVLNVLKVEYDK